MARPARWLLLALWLSASGPASSNGQLAIIIDDLGYNAALGERTLALPGAFTLAILPMAPQSPRLARLAFAQGKEIMLHNPMSNTRGLPMDPGGLSGAMEKARFLKVLDDNFKRIPQARGLNNHMGSQLTQEAAPMDWLMGHLKGRGFYFIDSRTTAASRAWEIARRYRVPSLKRDVFLDNERDVELIERQLDKAMALAQTRGYAIAIGHPYPETLTALEQLPARLSLANVELVPVSRLLAGVNGGLGPGPSGSCLAPPPALWYRTSNTMPESAADVAVPYSNLI